MKIGIPTEILPFESRVSLTPEGVKALIEEGHEVYLQQGAGEGSGFSDEQYVEVGAEVVPTAKDAWDVDMVVKVKQPLEEEFAYFKEDLIVFTYLHLAAEVDLTQHLLDSKVSAVAYETMEKNGTRPLLTPMSKIAGRLSVQIGTNYLLKQNGGKGLLLGGLPGSTRGRVTVIGGGVAGSNAAHTALGLGAEVTILDISEDRLKELEALFENHYGLLTLEISNDENIAKAIAESDLVVGAVLVPGDKAPTLVSDEMVAEMAEGSVIVDIAIDQGGIFASNSSIGTLERPYYVEHGVIHYAVPNMPGSVPRTSTFALTNESLDSVIKLANLGVKEAAREDHMIKTGINTYQGHLTVEPVAHAQEREYTDIDTLI